MQGLGSHRLFCHQGSETNLCYKLGWRGVALLDQMLGTGNKVIKYVLLLVHAAGISPRDAIFPSTPSSAHATRELDT